MCKAIFDTITACLEDFVASNAEGLRDIETGCAQHVFSPMAGFVGKKLSQAKAVSLLDECFQRAEDAFAKIAMRHSLEPWMGLLRRFPHFNGFGTEWLNYVTLGLIRYANSEHDSTFGKVKDGSQYGVVLAYTEEDFADAFRLAFLGREIDRISRCRRSVGKGAKLRPCHDSPIPLETPADVKVAVEEYERRRPVSFVFQDEGILSPKAFEALNHPVFGLVAPRCYLYVPGREIRLLCRHFPWPLDGGRIHKELRAYEDAITDRFGVGPDAILHFCSALGWQIARTILPVDSISEDLITLVADDGSPEYDHQLRFLFGLCQFGYLRFPREALVRGLSEVPTPWAAEGADATRLIEGFLNAFLLTADGDRDGLDLTTLRPLPFVYSSAGGEVYVDLSAMLDFFAWVIDQAKEWYSSQHGDRFTLALKQWIEAETGARVVRFKSRVESNKGKSSEVDLLVLHRDRLFAIECKAYAKSRDFFRGGPAAVRQRVSRIQEAVMQARSAAAAVSDALGRRDPSLPSAAGVEWLVCTPTQEFLCPADRYGFVTGKIPRVCTPEELVQVFSDDG